MNSPTTPADVEIMECTLRDGSYVINFQFTAADTRALVRALERVGFSLIEVGHGVGLGASEAGHGVAAETDEAYMRATAESVRDAKWGMFCIPGIARLEHVDMAADHGMNFIRIGTNVSDVDKSRPFIERARRHGMRVYANFMKSYATPPQEFARQVVLSADYGADVVYIVDSAGGMFPQDVVQYVDAVRSISDVKLGFHGHHNLGMAVANALTAMDAGVAVIDTSLQGFGRSSGNTPTEQFLCALERRGIATGIDALAAMDVGEHFITPLITARGVASLDIVCGWAQFHSSYMSVIRRFSSQYAVDPRRLILALCEHDKVNAPVELVESLARSLADKAAESDAPTPRYHFERYHGTEQA